MTLDIPLRMSGQPGLYKIPKELLFGARDKLKSVPYTWWPLEEFNNQQIGRFDLYSEDYKNWNRNEIISYVEENKVIRQPEFTQLSLGCFHLKNFLDASGQQGFIDSIREMCNENPQKMRFQKAEKLAKESYQSSAETFGAEEFQSEKKKDMAYRNGRKFGCYVLDVTNKDVNIHEVSMLGLTIEECVNQALKISKDKGLKFGNDNQNSNQNFKTKYSRYVFDFFKPSSELLDEDKGGYTEKIELTALGKSGYKKNKTQLNYIAVAFGSTIELEYDVIEEGVGESTLWVTLETGDAFVANSNVKRLAYRVKKTLDKCNQKLVLREGCLLLQAENN
mmetsp:Transcript_7603/g.12779  ORF Transcript_7603/g.12779 Transcript_7603/m.12779 type:complete len:335 (-) Transcript_7603:48-1052(-)